MLTAPFHDEMNLDLSNIVPMFKFFVFPPLSFVLLSLISHNLHSARSHTPFSSDFAL